MKRIYLFVLMFSLISGAVFGQDALENQRVYRIATINWAGWSFVQVAEEQGFWDELGLNVKVVHYPEGVLIHDAMRIGEVDFSMSMAGMMISKKENFGPITYLAVTDWSHGGDKILVQTGVDLREHLGTTLGVYVEGPTLKNFINLYLETIGLEISQFKIMVMYPNELAAQFKKGRLKAAILYDPYAFEVEESLAGVVRATSADFPGCIREILYTYQDKLKEMPEEDLVKLMRGIVRANRWINDPANRIDFFKILNNKTFKGYDPFTDAELATMLNDVRIIAPRELLAENSGGGKFQIYLERMFEFMVELGDLERVPKVKEYFDNRFIIRALELEGVK